MKVEFQLALAILLAGVSSAQASERFTVATYNVKNYLVESIPNRKAKPPEARQRVQQVLLHAQADVVVLQEMGRQAAINDLAAGLKRGGLHYPHRLLMQGHDRAIRLGLLSRFPIIQTILHTNDQFLIEGQRQWVRRGFLEAEIAVNENYRFTLLAAHLKSKFQVPYAREKDIRKKEAAIMRGKIVEILKRIPDTNLLVAGDLNDTPDSTAVRTVIGRGTQRLFDPKPGEWVFADSEFMLDRPQVKWTYYYPAGGAYTRVDYLLISRGMKREWRPESTSIAALPYWFEASDHRLVMAGFEATDRWQQP